MDNNSDVASLGKTAFTDAPWHTPGHELSTEAYCSVCLIDDNPEGQPKIKALCHLPIRARPDGPVNRNALRNAAARLSQTQADVGSLAAARKRLANLAEAAGIASSLSKIAGAEYGLIDVLKAYPNEHAARQASPHDFQRFARKTLAPGVTAIIGFPAVGGSRIQSVRFDAGRFSVAAAKQWLKAHDFSAAQFEAAREEAEKMGPIMSEVHIPGLMELDDDDEDNENNESDDESDKDWEELLAALATTNLTAHPTADKIHKQAEIVKIDSEQRVAYAVVYAPNTVDTQGDYATTAEIEKMAHRFLAQSRRYDLQHVEDVPADYVQVVESYLAPLDFDWVLPDNTSKHIAKGSWIVASYFANEPLWRQVKSGRIKSYSIYGRGRRIPIGENPL